MTNPLHSLEVTNLIDEGMRLNISHCPDRHHFNARQYLMAGFANNQVCAGSKAFRKWSLEDQTAARVWLTKFFLERTFKEPIRLNNCEFTIEPTSDARFIVAGKRQEFSLAKVTWERDDRDATETQAFIEEGSPLKGDNLLLTFTKDVDYETIKPYMAYDTILAVMGLYAAGYWLRETQQRW
jgi:hypothetical protein